MGFAPFSHNFKYRVAYQEADITPKTGPEKGILLQGLSEKRRSAKHAFGRLKLQMLLIEDAHYTKLLFVTGDLLEFDPQTIHMVRNAAAQWGIPAEALVMNASHTHYAPGVVSTISQILGPYNRDYTTTLTNAIINQLQALYNDLEPCRISVGAADISIGVNQRIFKDGKPEFSPNPEGPYDSHTPILVLDHVNRNKRVVVVNHGCHPMGLGRMTVLSPDFPGFLRQYLVEKKVANAVMFLQGGAGNIMEAKRSPSLSGGEDVSFCSSAEDVVKNGQALGEAVENVLKEGLSEVRGPFFSVSDIARLPFEKVYTSETFQEIIKNPNSPTLVRHWAQVLLSRMRNTILPEETKIGMQLLGIGKNVRMITIQGEPMAETSCTLKELIPDDKVAFLLGYTNGAGPYLPTDEILDQGGYDVETSCYVSLQPAGFKKGIEEQLQNTLQRMLAFDAEKKTSAVYGQYHRFSIDSTQPAFFTMSAGRCGTMSLARMLDTAENAKVWHHPKPFMINEALKAYHGEVNPSETFWRCRSTFLQAAWAKGLIYGETDLNMTPFCTAISKDLPNAKFIVLTGNPKDFVRSGMRRKYYMNNPWDSGRLRPKEDDPDFETFATMLPFEKVCWLWGETYRRIEAFVDEIGRERVMLVKAEDLMRDISTVKNIFDFIGLSGYDENKIVPLLENKLNEQQEGCFPEYKNWSGKQKEALSKYCLRQAASFGYDGIATSKKQSGPNHADNPSPWIGTVRTPKISVGLPVYNGGEELVKSIESILNQNFEDFELIISDNASTDQTREIVERYLRWDKRVRYSRLESNQGITTNLRNTLGLSLSEFFIWTQHDNQWEADLLSECLPPLLKDSSILLTFPSALITKNGQVVQTYHDPLNAMQNSAEERYLHVLSHLRLCNAFLGLFRKQPLLKTTALTSYDLYRGTDNLLLAEIALMGKIKRIDKPLLIRGMDKAGEDADNPAVIKRIDPTKIKDGLTLPIVRMAIEHLTIIARSDLPNPSKRTLFDKAQSSIKKRFGKQMEREIKRALELIENDNFFVGWDGEDVIQIDNNCNHSSGKCRIEAFYIHNLIKRLTETSIFFEDWDKISNAIQKLGALVKLRF